MNKTSKVALGVIAVAVILLAYLGVKSLLPQGSSLGGNSTLSGLNVAAQNGDTFTVGTVAPLLTISGNSGFLYTAGGLSEGGGVNATTSNNSVETLKASDLSPYNLISVTPGKTAGLTEILPATSTITTLIPNAGDSYSLDIYNATTAASIPLGLQGGTGWNIALVGTTSAASSATSTSKRGMHLEIIRLSNTDILGIISTTQ